MMYKLLNGFLPNIMSEICMVNNELHDHFTKQSHFLHTIKGSNHVNILVPIAKFKITSKVFFQENILEWNYSK